MLRFFQSSTGNLLDSEAAAGVGHHVALSVVGTDRLSDSGYFRAKIAHEKLITESSIPYSIVHATQFFEFIISITDAATDGDTVRLAPVLIQPMAAEDVASAVADVALGPPVNGIVAVAGPQQFRLDELVRSTLHERHDPPGGRHGSSRAVFSAPDCTNVPSSRRRRPPSRDPLRPLAEPDRNRQAVGDQRRRQGDHMSTPTAGLADGNAAHRLQDELFGEQG